MYRAVGHRVTLSWVLCALDSTVALLHLFPPLVYSAQPRTAVVTAFINSVGPGWLVLFGVSALSMAYSLVWHRARHIGHLPAVFTWMTYATALWYGAIGSDPNGPVMLPCLATALVAVHLIVATTYAEDSRRRRRAH